ncbi:MAG: hypothetical protein LRY71_14950 [Bacillaceae bacterium]|nr:hypothetical protein [Bacillaceae bacterium]
MPNINNIVLSSNHPTIIREKTEFKPINILGNKDRFTISAPNRETNLGNNNNSNDYPTINNRNLFDKPRWNNNNTNPMTINKNVTIGGLHVENKNVIMTNSPNNARINLDFGRTINGNFTGGMYVKGNLTIGNPNYNDSLAYEKFRINGPIFVEGNLTVIGADIEFNSTVYVTGSTSIRDSRITGIPHTAGSEESSLVLFGNNSISIANISSFENDRDNISKIRGFFYTNEQLEMYGVGSNIQLEGGIFAESIVLNAIRGNSYNQYSRNSNQYYSPDWWAGWVNHWWFTRDNRQATLPPTDSRLIIRHNPELIENPPDALPAIDDIQFRVTKREIQ